MGINSSNPHLNKYRAEFKNNPILNSLQLLYFYQLKLRFLSLMAGGNIPYSYHRRNKWDKKWIITLINDYRFYCKISEGEGFKIPMLDGRTFSVIDAKIAPAIFVLNKVGIKTGFCCEGNPARGHSLTAYISLKKGYSFPVEILEQLKNNNVDYILVPENKERASYGHGQALYADNFEKDNQMFLEIVNKWATIHNISPIKFKDQWKYVI